MTTVDTPNTRDLQFLITDGETFCHEERRDLLHHLEYPEPDSLLYRLTNSDRAGRYRLAKEIVVDPHSSVLLMQTQLGILDTQLRGKLRLFALLAPHMKGPGKNNSASWCGIDGRKLFDAQREDINMSFGCTPDFSKRFRGLKKYGLKRWTLHVIDVIERLKAALEPSDTVIGGGNVKKLQTLPRDCRASENANAFIGGFRLWTQAGHGRNAVSKARVASRSTPTANERARRVASAIHIGN